jgi:long-subunit fatty acid transport protein
MRQRDGLLIFFLVLATGLLIYSPAQALVAGSSSYNLNFQFNNPGARANAMGGAFIGLADDATAAYTNPAGLTILTESEVSVEYKLAEYDNLFPTATGPGAGPTFDIDETGRGFSFISLVFPAKNATFSLYRHQLINQSSEDEFIFPPDSIFYENDIEAVTHGGAIGLKFSESFSMGASVGFAQLRYYNSYQIFNNNVSASGPPNQEALIDGQDSAEHYSLAMLWNPVGRMNLGFVYRQGPEFKHSFTLFNDVGDDGDFDEINVTKSTLKVPDVYGLGISYRFDFGLTIAADLNYVEYSDLLKDFRFFDGSTSIAGINISDFDVDDEFEYHLGLEFVFSGMQLPLALRGGYWFKPDHRIMYDAINPVFQALAPEGEDDHIFSVGVGTVFLGNVQVDAAASFGDFEKIYTVSFVYRFE